MIAIRPNGTARLSHRTKIVREQRVLRFEVLTRLGVADVETAQASCKVSR